MSVISLEAAFVAQLLSQPNLVQALGLKAEVFREAVPRKIVRLLQEGGSVYSAPGPLLAALETSDDQTEWILQNIPNQAATSFAELLSLYREIEASFELFNLGCQLEIVAKRAKEGKDVAAELGRINLAFKTKQLTVDSSGSAVKERTKKQSAKTRWLSGCPDLDYNFPGIGPDGKKGYGLLAQRELVGLNAAYKAGKTRQALGFIPPLLEQGATVSLFVLEDDEGSYAWRLISSRVDVPTYKLEWYFAGELPEDDLDFGKCVAGEAWFDAISEQLYIYDTVQYPDLRDPRRCFDLILADKALHHTTHTFVDYLQAFKGSSGDYALTSEIGQELRDIALKQNLCVVLLSQLSNDSIQFGSGDGQFKAKGSGDIAAAVHIGLEIELLKNFDKPENCLRVKIARKAPKSRVYVWYNPQSGAILDYNPSPRFELDSNYVTLQPKPKGRK